MRRASENGGSLGGAVGWVTIEAIIRQGGHFLVTMVLARLVAPEAFGLIAVLLALSTIASVFVNGGFPSALIQKRNVSDADASTAFWINIAAASLFAALFALSAPALADFFRDERLVPLAWLMSLNIWLSGWQTVHRALLTREFDFRSQFLATAWATCASGAAAITAALMGAGVWALLIHTLLGTLVATLLIWRMNTWRPSRTFSRTSFIHMFRFGFFMSVSALINVLGTRFYTLLIGRLFPAGDLGQFHQAVTMRELPQGLLSTIFGRVVFPLLSSRHRDGNAFNEGMRSALRSGMAVNLPLMLGIGASAPALIPTVFGSQWMPAVPILQIICLAGALWPMQSVNITALAALGHSRLIFRLEVAKKLILICAAILASPLGLSAIAWSMVAASSINLPLNSYIASRHHEYRISRQLADILPYAALAAAMGAVVWLLESSLVEVAAPWRLGMECVLGATLYIGVGHMIGLRAFRDTSALVKIALSKQHFRKEEN